MHLRGEGGGTVAPGRVEAGACTRGGGRRIYGHSLCQFELTFWGEHLRKPELHWSTGRMDIPPWLERERIDWITGWWNAVYSFLSPLSSMAWIGYWLKGNQTNQPRLLQMDSIFTARLYPKHFTISASRSPIHTHAHSHTRTRTPKAPTSLSGAVGG